MRKLKILIVILFGCFLLSACNLFGEETKEPTKGPTIVETENPLETPTPTPTTEATITEIYVGNLEDFYVCVGDTFNTSSLVIMAKYSDNTTKNISNEVNFSSISTSSPGKKKLNISYLDFSISVDINVLIPTGIEINYDNVKVEYNLGETIDLSNLFVYNVFENDLKLDVQQYTIVVRKENGDSLLITDVLAEAGKYIISIHSKGYNTSYEITVINEDSPTGIPAPDVEPTELELDLENVKKTFENEEFNYENLVLYAVYPDSKEVVPNTDYTVSLVNGAFTVSGEYIVKVTYTGKFEFTVNELIYKVNYIESDTDNKTIKFSYSGYSQYKEFTGIVTPESKPEDFIKTEPGYVFTGFSSNFKNWNEDDFVKVYLKKIDSGKFCVVLYEDDYTYIWADKFAANTTISRADLNIYSPNYTPEGMKFSHWDLPESFNITETVYAKPIYVPSDFNTTNITAENTVYNVAANSIDVNVDDFINATPDGYTLDSITLGLDGKIIAEIPYQNGMLGAYFDGLTNNTEYEVGAYYSQNQATTLAFRRNRQLTYRFHFVGFMIVTSGDVMYRVRMTYQGDTLYRWYYAENYYVSNYHFFYDFALPIEYEEYKCVGCEEFIGNITSDIDLEVVLIPPAGDTCTVVFYTEDYIYGDETILKTQVVNKGESATPPTIEQSYIVGNYEYVLSGWSVSYTNVTTNVYTYPIYEPRALIDPTVQYSLIIGDTYCFYMAETDMPELVIDSEVRIFDSSNNLVWSDIINAGHMYDSRYHSTEFGILEKNTNYTIEFFPIYDGHLLIYESQFSITTRKGTEKLGYNFNAQATSSHSYSLNMNYVDVRSFVEYNKDSSGNVINFGLINRSDYKKHNTIYYINPITDVKDQTDASDWGDNIMYVYFDNITVKTLDAIVPNVFNTYANVGNGMIIVDGYINDNSKIVKEITLCYKVTDNSNYIHKRIQFISNPIINFHYEQDLSVVDPDTGITHLYEVEDAYLLINYVYGGYLSTMKHNLGE